jgi:hypothetical protein
MPPISLAAIALAFAVEWLADYIIGAVLFLVFAPELPASGTTPAEIQRISREMIATTAFLPWAFALGSVTTVGGGYLAARVARRVPYYHGLAIGIVGILYIFVMWHSDGGASQYAGLFLTIPLSILGAHFARKHMPPQT